MIKEHIIDKQKESRGNEIRKKQEIVSKGMLIMDQRFGELKGE